MNLTCLRTIALAVVCAPGALFTAEEQALIVRVSEAYFGHLAARDNMEFVTAERIAIGRQLAEPPFAIDGIHADRFAIAIGK